VIRCSARLRFGPVLATVRVEARDQASAKAGPAKAAQVEARLVEELDPAELVEDRQEGKEHREFDQAWTSC
jgi:hypothetical protein